MGKSTVDIASQLTRLEGRALLELRQEWRRLHQTLPPMRLSRDILLRGIAYKLQETALRGLSKSTLRKLQSSDPDGQSMPQDRRPSALFKPVHGSFANGTM